MESWSRITQKKSVQQHLDDRQKQIQNRLEILKTQLEDLDEKQQYSLQVWNKRENMI